MKRILIIRPSAIGDIVMASPMIRALRGNYPDSHLAWLIESYANDLLAYNDGLDEVIHWPKKEWKGLLRHGHFIKLGMMILRFIKGMRHRKFDLAIDVQGLFRSRLIAYLSGARERIGFDSKEPGRFLMTRIIDKGIHTGIMGSEYKHMMHILGIDTPAFHPEIILSPGIDGATDRILSELKAGERYAVFAPFTTRPHKHWFNDRWAALAGSIHRNMGLPIIMLGGRDDLEAAIAIENLAQGDIMNLAGRTTLGQSAAIIKRASLLIGVDTGLTHMGAAFDCPTLALFGATCPYLKTEGLKTLVIYNRLSCSPCRRTPVCNGDFTCMRSIETGQVLEAVKKLLEAS